MSSAAGRAPQRGGGEPQKSTPDLAPHAEIAYFFYMIGGLFGLYVLFHRPGAFSRYLLVSPSIWWVEAVRFTFEQAWAARHGDLPARVFLAVGEGRRLQAAAD